MANSTGEKILELLTDALDGLGLTVYEDFSKTDGRTDFIYIEIGDDIVQYEEQLVKSESGTETEFQLLVSKKNSGDYQALMHTWIDKVKAAIYDYNFRGQTTNGLFKLQISDVLITDVFKAADFEDIRFLMTGKVIYNLYRS